MRVWTQQHCLPILASVVAAKAFEEADLMSVSFEKFSPYGGGTPLWSSLRVKVKHVNFMPELPVQHALSANLIPFA